jgi:hypothetical protein
VPPRAPPARAGELVASFDPMRTFMQSINFGTLMQCRSCSPTLTTE